METVRQPTVRPSKAEKVVRIQDQLESLYPETPVPLDHHDPFTLLIAVLLSAQTTDKKVNEVTPDLWKLGASPGALAQADPQDIRMAIRQIGLAPTKAKNVHRLSQILCESHDGQVPQSFEALEALPGVGHKTASVVMSQAFGVPAFPVDTHIHRLAWRWGLSSGKNVTQTEKDLKRLFSRDSWNKLHLQIIFFGREYCPARRHDWGACPICSWAGGAARQRQEAKAHKKGKKAGSGRKASRKPTSGRGG